jgi:RNA polymerase sigma factor for flagellar operon FliA
VRAIAQPYTQLAEQARRNELIESHLRLVRHILGKLVARLPPGVDVENLESAATLGLVEAANKFDPERGVKFETYAYTRIRGAVLDELRRNCPLPQQVLERVARVRKAYEGLPPGCGTAALAASAGLTEDEVADCLAALRLTRMTSWEADPLDALVADRAAPPDVLAERSEQKELLADGIQALPERERLVVMLYYMEDLRLKEIGTLLNLSESRVSRVLSAALFRLGEYVRARQA